MLEPVDADISAVAARAALDIVEMAENGGALVARIFLFQIKLTGEEGTTAGSIDDEAGCPVAGGTPIIDGVDEMRSAGAGAEGDIFDPHALVRLDTFRDGVTIQQLIELRSPYLIRKRVSLVERLCKVNGLGVPSMITWAKLGAVFRHAYHAHLIKNAEPFEDRQVHRQQRFADMKPRMAILLEQDDPPTFLFQQDGDGGTSRTTADDDCIACRFGRRNEVHYLTPILPSGWRAGFGAATNWSSTFA